MKITKTNLHAHELLGLKVDCFDQNYNKLASGIVINETKETLEILENSKKKIIQKKENIFVFYLKNNPVTIKGNLLKGKAEDRIKRL